MYRYDVVGAMRGFDRNDEASQGGVKEIPEPPREAHVPTQM